MPGSLAQTEATLEDCRSLLNDRSLAGTPVENILTRHLIITLCAEVEISVRNRLHQYISANSSASVANFVGKLGVNVVRNARYSEIKDVMKLLDNSYAVKFENTVRSNLDDADIERVSNVVTARNNIAHGTPTQVTFGEAERAFLAAQQLVDAVDDVLGDD